ncbi:MAG: hypothetical protein ABXS93_08005 [Sulfurimonas sp.]
MNKIIVASLCALIPLSLFADSSQESKYDPTLCKVFQEKIKTYEKKMRKDSYAQKTLESYKKRAKIYCTKK